MRQKQKAIAYGSLTANTTNVGPNVSITTVNTVTAAAGAESNADTLLAEVAERSWKHCC